MKDKRNCNMNNYPVYSQPMMVPPFGYPNIPMNNMPNGYNNLEQQLNNINEQLNLLDKRISRLENLNSNTTTNNYTKYNDSNYYMV